MSALLTVTSYKKGHHIEHPAGPLPVAYRTHHCRSMARQRGCHARLSCTKHGTHEDEEEK